MGQSVVGACGLALGMLLAAATGAAAAEAPIFAAVPAWVKPAALPTSAPLDNPGAAVRNLLYDTQISAQANGLATYTAYARRIETTAGLNNTSAVLIPWRPDIDTVTIHHVRIRRGDATIDLLKDGKAVSILRRESGLEYRTLDGVLTATVQPEGVQVGDVIEVAYTTVSLDPNLGGHMQALARPLALPNAQVINFRAVLPKDRKLTWRAADLPAELKQSGGELLLNAPDPARVEVPRGAPGRYRMGARVELADFASWREVSALFQPLFAKARTISPDSALKAEIERIKAASSDPVVQASAALALVEDKVRYFAVTLDNGGYRPANADDTWSRRYGDCKAKTALLLALLDGLGIKAEAALVSSKEGDGLDQRLPMPGAFDHVIVRAAIAGQTYWLDGTRSGDTSITSLSPPGFIWALPLIAGGQDLQPIVQRPLDKPMSEVVEVYDASAGFNLYAKAHFESTYRGEAAHVLKSILAIATPALREDALRTAWTRRYPSLKLASNTAVVDPISGDVRMVADGQIMLPWAKRGETMRAVEVGAARLPVAEDFDHYPVPTTPQSAVNKPAKPPIRQVDAPFAITFPTYVVSEVKIILPKAVSGLSVIGANVDRTLAGKVLMRNASLADGVVTVRASVRTLVPEISAAEAKAAKSALNQIAADRIGVSAPEALFSEQKRFEEAWAKTPTTKDDYLQRAAILATRRMYAEALLAADKSIVMGETGWNVHSMRAKLLQDTGRFVEASSAYDKALATPGIPAAQAASLHIELARIDSMQGRYKAALAKLDSLIEAKPNDADLLLLRGQTRWAATQEDAALADFDVALAAAPNNLGVYVAKASLLASQKKPDAAAGVLTTMTANNPLSFDAYGRAGEIYYRMGRLAEARAAAERSLILKPTAAAYIERARYRPLAEKTAALDDLKAALALDSSIRNLGRAGQMQIELGDYEGAVRNLSAGMKLSDDTSFPTYLIAAYEASGQRDLAATQYAAVRAKAGKNPVALNSLCWAQATTNVSLTRALADCDAALAIQRNAAFHDSRALVLLRLGRNADAVAAYDRALDLRPDQAASLYGRGLAKLAMGNEAQGKADLDAARERQPTITREFSGYGLEAPAP